MSVSYLHTKVRVRDLARAIGFYVSAFGYRVRKRKPGPEDSELAFLGLEGEEGELQLAHYPGEEAFAVPARLLHLAFRVTDLDDTIQRATTAGATLRSGPYVLPSGSRVAFVLDPDGYELELVQKPERP